MHSIMMITTHITYRKLFSPEWLGPCALVLATTLLKCPPSSMLWPPPWPLLRTSFGPQALTERCMRTTSGEAWPRQGTTGICLSDLPRGKPPGDLPLPACGRWPTKEKVFSISCLRIVSCLRSTLQKYSLTAMDIRSPLVRRRSTSWRVMFRNAPDLVPLMNTYP